MSYGFKGSFSLSISCVAFIDIDIALKIRLGKDLSNYLKEVVWTWLSPMVEETSRGNLN